MGTARGTARGTAPLSAQTIFSTPFPLFSFSKTPPAFPPTIHPHPHHHHHQRQPPQQEVGNPPPRPLNSLCFPQQDDPSAIQLAGASLTIRHGFFFHDHITNEQLHETKSRRHTLSPTGAPASEGVRRSQLSFCEGSTGLSTTTPNCRCPRRSRCSSPSHPREVARQLHHQNRHPPHSKCQAQAWLSRPRRRLQRPHQHQHQHQHHERRRALHSQRENTSASFVRGPLAGANIAAATNVHVRFISSSFDLSPSLSRWPITRLFPLGFLIMLPNGHANIHFRYQGATIQVSQVQKHIRTT